MPLSTVLFGVRLQGSNGYLSNLLFCPQLLAVTPVTTNPELCRAAAGGANASSQAMDRMGPLGSRYSPKQLQNPVEKAHSSAARRVSLALDFLVVIVIFV